MAQRDKLRQQIQTFLNPHEKIEHLFVGQIGGNPTTPNPGVAPTSKYRVFAATKKGIYVFSASPLSQQKPRKLLELIPPSRVIVAEGYWREAHIGSDQVWVHPHWHTDVDATDAFMRTVIPHDAPAISTDEPSSPSDATGRSTNAEEPSGVGDIIQSLLENRICFVGHQIDDELADTIVTQLRHLAGEDPNRDVHLYINSPGGSVTSGLAICDAMDLIEPDVSTLCIGEAHGMAAIMLASGAKGKRFALPHSGISFPKVVPGVATSDLDSLQKITDTTAELLVKHTQLSRSRVDQLMDGERLSAKDAKQLGIVDDLIEQPPSDDDATDTSKPTATPQDAPPVSTHEDRGPSGSTNQSATAEEPTDDAATVQTMLAAGVCLINQDLDDALANVAVAQMLHLAAEDDSDVWLYLNSRGGSVNSGLAICDAMDFVNQGVTTVALDFVGGLTTLLLASGAKGKRYALPHSQISIAKLTVAPTEPATRQAELPKITNTLAELYVKHTGLSRSRVDQLMEGETLSAEDALRLGFIDHIVEQASQLPFEISQIKEFRYDL